MSDKTAILHVSDWNYQDKYYESPLRLIKDFGVKVKSDGLEKAWEWWTSQVRYTKRDRKKPIKTGTVNMQLDTFFFDYMNPIESIGEWEF